MRMEALIVALCIEAVLVFLVFPIKLTCKAHFSLGSEIAVVQFKFAGISVVRIKACVQNGLKVQINGKTVQKRRKKPSAMSIGKIVRFLLENDIVKAGDLIAYVGNSDAKNGAMMCALLQMLSIFSKTVIKDSDKDRFDVECDIVIKINAVQFAKTIALGKGR